MSTSKPEESHGSAKDEMTSPQDKRLDVLFTWLQTCDERVSRWALVAILIVVGYAYYGAISPLLNGSRLDKLKQLRADLVLITTPFELLRNKYVVLVAPG